MKRLLTFISVLLFTVSHSSAQTWNTVGSGLPGNWGVVNPSIVSDTVNGEIYVAFNKKNKTTSGIEVHVQKWNGSSWTAYPTISGVDFYVNDIVVNDTIIYIIGSKTPALDVAFYEFNGSSWTAKAPIGFVGVCHTGELVNGNLIVGGGFTTTGSIYNLFSYNGTNYSSYPTLGNGYISDIHEFNNDIYVANPTSLSANILGFKRLIGSTWTAPAHFHQGTSTFNNEYKKIFEFNNELYVTLGDKEPDLFRLGNDTLHLIGKINHNVNDIEEYEGEVYMVGDTTSNTSTSTERITKYDGSTLTPIFNSPWGLKAIDVLDSSLYVFSNAAESYNGNTYNYAFRTQANFSILNGYVFLDVNKDCYRNGTETDIPGAVIEFTGNTIFTSADNNGFYSVGLPAGTYGFDSVYVPDPAYKNFDQSCSLLNQITLGQNQSVYQSFGLVNNSGVDMMVKITPYRGLRARFGFVELYQIDIINTGSYTQTNAGVVVEIPLSFIYKNSSPSPSNILPNNKYLYNFSNIEPQERQTIVISAEVDVSQNALNDTVDWYSYFYPSIIGDVDTLDNIDIVSQCIVGAYDPNDKHASASTILPNTNHIDYHINFQNTGNDTAYKVTVVDTLDLSIPIVSVMINAASHAYNLSVINNILIWEFENILLPDSGANFIGSQGFVNFTVNISQGLVVGDTVKNDAQIYFDYQSPIHTNTAKTLVIEESSPIGIEEGREYHLNIQAYPNPASNAIYLKSNAVDITSVRIIDVNGKILDILTLEPGKRVYYPIQKLETGIYFIQENNQSLKFIISR